MDRDSQSLSAAEVQTIDAEASVHMKEGIRLMEGASAEGTVKALECFDRALELRRRLPVATSPQLRYGLAACWLNRADALMRLGAPEQIQLALTAHDEALALLRDLPLDLDPLFPRRLAIAHQNRGLALQFLAVQALTQQTSTQQTSAQQAGAQQSAGPQAPAAQPPAQPSPEVLAQVKSASAEAVREFAQAIEILEHDNAEGIGDRRYLSAAVWLNLANAELFDASAQGEKRAAEAARRAIEMVADLEREEPYGAEVGMKARHVLCRAMAQRLSQITESGGGMPGDVHDATDAADEGLALARHWEQKGMTGFRGVAYDLFRFGMRVYARYQPQFLGEFVAENMDPAQSSASYVESAEMRSAASEAVGLVAQMGR